MTTNRPRHFDTFPYEGRTVSQVDQEGRFTITLDCGCIGYFRKVLSGPLRGHTYGDARYALCRVHDPRCTHCNWIPCQCEGS